MEVFILGNGGAVNRGLPYNSFLIDRTLLCETPPDVMRSLHGQKIDPLQIKTIFISHLHGDHTFGLPFLLLHAFFAFDKEDTRTSFTILGPRGIAQKAEELLVSAFTKHHPCLAWMKSFCSFTEVNASSRHTLIEGLDSSFFRLKHLVETYGFSLLSPTNGMLLSYVADTMWCRSIEEMLLSLPKAVLIDLNGEEDDPKPIHLSMKTLIEKALPITRQATQYYGTHLKEVFVSQSPNIHCTVPGMIIEL